MLISVLACTMCIHLSFYLQGVENIQKAVENRAAFVKTKQIASRPYLLVEGPSLQNIKSYYIVAENTRYQFSSCMKAIDTLFKLYHVVNLEYPIQSQHILLLIQRNVYLIRTELDNVTPNIVDLI